MVTMNSILRVFSYLAGSRFDLSSKLLALSLLFAVGSTTVSAGIVQPAPGEAVTRSSITVSWTEEPGALGYMLGVGTSAASRSGGMG